MLHDIRYSVRLLAKHPAFTSAAVLVLALGISINTALFSIVYAALFRPLSVHAPGELVYLYTVLSRQPDRPLPVFEERFYEYLRDHNEAFTALTGHWGMSYMLTANEQTDSVRGELVLGNYFDLLGVTPALGRTHEVETHVRGALNNGLTQQQIAEVLVQTAIYCGVPAAVDSFRAASKVIAEYGK